MQNEATFVIDEKGDCKYLLTETAKAFDLGGTPRRASYVEPSNTYLRLVFRVIRKLVSDDSQIAQWTRGWSGVWRVDLRPIGGPILSPRYYDRGQAINAEVAAINLFWTETTFQTWLREWKTRIHAEVF